jgi:hypothetical protein
MITMATIKIFHGLSNRSPIISVLSGGDEPPRGRGISVASVHVRSRWPGDLDRRAALAKW